jgi:23S rRNA pseudouridine1911/1915/1917 synthase
VSSPEKIRLVVAAEDAGLRLDQFLAARVPGLSRRRARVVLDIGGVYVDRARVKVAGRKVREGQRVEVVLGGALERATARPGREAREADASRLPRYELVFEDEDVLVVYKPAGLLTAPTPESDRGNLLDLLQRRRNATGQVWLVHRIDLDTSGLLVFARSERANRDLAEAFREHRVEREYVAVVEGTWPAELARIDEPVEGKRAVSHFAIERRFEHATQLAVTLETGRTHQIRLHTAGVGHPVLGDRRYGTPSALKPPRMALHARVLGFRHPGSGEELRFERELPEDLKSWLAAGGDAPNL